MYRISEQEKPFWDTWEGCVVFHVWNLYWWVFGV